MDRDYRSEEGGVPSRQSPSSVDPDTAQPGAEAAEESWRIPVRPPEFVLVGRVAAAHGIKGEIRVVPIETPLERLLELESLILRPPGPTAAATRREVRVLGSRPHRSGVLFALEGLQERSQAEALRGWWVEVRGGQVKPLPPGHYYVFELVGCSVYTTDGREMGVVTDVLPTGANDVYVVKTPRGGEVLIPAVRAMVKAVDVAARRIEVDPWPGLWDEDDGQAPDAAGKERRRG